MNSDEACTILGDVHGDATRLSRALDTFLKLGAPLILVGDYVNRGPDSRKVLDLLIVARNRYRDRLVLLRGNHDQSLLNFLNGGSLSDFAAHGGISTIRSYLDHVSDSAIKDFRNNFPTAHRKLLEQTNSYYQTDSILVSHTGFDPANPNSRDPAAMYEHGHPGIFTHQGPWPRDTTVCGHYVQKHGDPYMGPHLVCIDTGCGTVPRGHLTAVSFPDRSVMQF